MALAVRTLGTRSAVAAAGVLGMLIFSRTTGMFCFCETAGASTAVCLFIGAPSAVARALSNVRPLDLNPFPDPSSVAGVATGVSEAWDPRSLVRASDTAVPASRAGVAADLGTFAFGGAGRRLLCANVLVERTPARATT